MIQSDHIILGISMIIFMLLMILTARYIYGERCFLHPKSWVIFGGMYLCAEIFAVFISGELGEGLMSLFFIGFFSVMIAITRKSKKIRGLFLIFPIMGITMSIEMIPSMAFHIFVKENSTDLSNPIIIIELFYDILIVSIISLWIKRNRGLLNFELGTWERRILNTNGLLLLIIYAISTVLPKDLSHYQRYLLLGGVIISIMIIITSIIMTIESTNANIYKVKSEINEYYLQTQLNHFKTYQETQKETRRIKHDMRNHMICIKDLYERGEYGLLGDYIMDLSQMTQKIDREYHIGNDMADAILNEKLSQVKQYEIELIIEGSMTEIKGLAPIDICTLFANALDNAIEEIKRLQLIKAVLTVTVKRNNRIVLITFTNPCNKTKGIMQVKTRKADTINHGFGMDNMRKTADKYNGNVKCSILEEENNQGLFCLEIMLIL